MSKYTKILFFHGLWHLQRLRLCYELKKWPAAWFPVGLIGQLVSALYRHRGVMGFCKSLTFLTYFFLKTTQAFISNHDSFFCFKLFLLATDQRYLGSFWLKKIVTITDCLRWAFKIYTSNEESFFAAYWRIGELLQKLTNRYLLITLSPHKKRFNRLNGSWCFWKYCCVCFCSVAVWYCSVSFQLYEYNVIWRWRTHRNTKKKLKPVGGTPCRDLYVEPALSLFRKGGDFVECSPWGACGIKRTQQHWTLLL